MNDPRILETTSAIKGDQGRNATDITLRDMFAAFVIAGDLGHPEAVRTLVEAAELAYKQADAMLTELAK